MEELTTTRFSFGDFELDGARRRLLKQGQPVALNYRTFELLFALVSRRGEILSKDDLLATVWEGQFVEEGNLTVHISALRKALGESKNENKFIVTVPGRGYSFVAELNDATGDDIIIESHTRSEIFVEEEIVEGEERRSGEREIAHDEKFLAPSPGLTLSLSQKIAVAVVAAVALVAGGYALRNSFAKKAAVPFRDIAIKRLTTKGIVSSAALSPDGKLFVYAIPEGEQESLWLGHVDGGEPVQIRPAAKEIILSLQFSPDASSIYYSVGETFGAGILYKMPVFGGAAEKIPNNFEGMSFAPDGKRIAFFRNDEKRKKKILLSAEVAGENEREIAVLPGDNNSGWHSISWSPDSSKIALAESVKVDDTELFTVDEADGSVKQLTPQAWRRLQAISWLPDASGMIAVGIERNSILAQLWFISFPNGEVRHLIPDLNEYGYMTSVAKDSSLLALQGISQSNIWVTPANNLAEAKQITFGSAGLQAGWNGLVWTPDGRVIYAASTNDGATLWIMNADGSQQKQLVPNGGINSYPSLTSDGHSLIFQSNRSGHFAVWRSDIDGRNMIQLTGEQIAGQPFVSPDGKWVLYNTHIDSDGELWRMPFGGGDPQLVTDKPAGWAQISPDSKFIACEMNVDDKIKLAILLLETGELIKSFDVPRLGNLRLGVHWTPDGRAVTYRDWTNGIWRQNLDGGEPQRLNGLPEEKLFCYGWSPDGRTFAFTRGNTARDAVLITGLSQF
jgi:Tol biopolymer transport system component/DNA-binding winged helix-turn-helix (wHTH) protein